MDGFERRVDTGAVAGVSDFSVCGSTHGTSGGCDLFFGICAADSGYNCDSGEDAHDNTKVGEEYSESERAKVFDVVLQKQQQNVAEHGSNQPEDMAADHG